MTKHGQGEAARGIVAQVIKVIAAASVVIGVMASSWVAGGSWTQLAGEVKTNSKDVAKNRTDLEAIQKSQRRSARVDLKQDDRLGKVIDALQLQNGPQLGSACKPTGEPGIWACEKPP